MAVHLLRYGETSRSISFVCPSPQASATWEVHDLLETNTSSNYIADSGSATVDATSLSPSATAGPGTSNSRRINFASTTNVTIGNFYEIAEDGRSEVVEAVGLSANAYVDVKHPLVGTYSTAATFRGLTITAALSDTIAATQEYVDYDEPLRIVWSLADGSRRQEQIRVVREDYGDLDFAQILSDVRSLFPDVGTHLQHNNQGTLEDMIRTVIRLETAAILADGEEPQRILHGDQGNATIVWAAFEHMAAMNVRPGAADDPQIWMDYCKMQHRRYWSNTRAGRAGARTTRIAPVTESATGNTDQTHRRRLKWG